MVCKHSIMKTDFLFLFHECMHSFRSFSSTLLYHSKENRIKGFQDLIRYIIIIHNIQIIILKRIFISLTQPYTAKKDSKHEMF